ncbi:MAG TPA: alkaline phosphatase family protein, partial [Phycisphaerales bacterium]|nr:alkaline phosphatase family protein [Phycisphaerales bacterium]
MRTAIALSAALLVATASSVAQPPDPGLSPPVVSALRAEPDARPRLVVVISVDQLRADYLTRLADLFGDGGFKRLTGGGAWFTNARYAHYPLTTGPGHALLLTGAAPYKSG